MLIEFLVPGGLSDRAPAVRTAMRLDLFAPLLQRCGDGEKETETETETEGKAKQDTHYSEARAGSSRRTRSESRKGEAKKGSRRRTQQRAAFKRERKTTTFQKL